VAAAGEGFEPAGAVADVRDVHTRAEAILSQLDAAATDPSDACHAAQRSCSKRAMSATSRCTAAAVVVLNSSNGVTSMVAVP